MSERDEHMLRFARLIEMDEFKEFRAYLESRITVFRLKREHCTNSVEPSLDNALAIQVAATVETELRRLLTHCEFVVKDAQRLQQRAVITR